MPNIANNKRVSHDYFVLEKFEAGIMLSGQEVKSAKLGHVNFIGSYVSLDPKGEAWIVGCHISPYKHAGKLLSGYDPIRPRKLLLNKKELIYLKTKTREAGLTILPLSVYTKGSLVKIDIGVARGKKKHDKRADLKKKDINKEIREKMRGKLKMH